MIAVLRRIRFLFQPRPRVRLALVSYVVLGFFLWTHAGQAQTKKPKILVIFGDDVGLTDISAYGMGVMGFKTPSIDRIAKEGLIFTDSYAENSCTAGRSTFITGQAAWRTGLSKVGVPGGPAGLQPRDITIAQALKPLGYATGQFGKNHLGDRDEFLPTNHGFDEFFGILYQLNAEEEPEHPYWFSNNPEFLKAYNPRGVIRAYSNGKIEDTGRLDTKQMEGMRRTTAFLQTFIEYPPSQLPASFSIDQITEGISKRIEQMQEQQKH
jgi:arylsulfatase A-like enzyme